MKRSEINTVIKKFETLLNEYRFALPPYLNFTPADWESKGHEYDEIRDNALGWDVTDYGEGHFDTLGLALITIRNGNVHNPKYKKIYAEKIMMCDSGQVSPMHYHKSKMEDIINRGGNDVIFTFYNVNPATGEYQDSDVLICQDGRQYALPAGSKVTLHRGESMTLYPYLAHEFIIPEGGPALIGEVSMTNDDNTDNFFKEPLGRYPAIEEDEKAYRLLCNEYPNYEAM